MKTDIQLKTRLIIAFGVLIILAIALVFTTY